MANEMIKGTIVDPAYKGGWYAYGATVKCWDTDGNPIPGIEDVVTTWGGAYFFWNPALLDEGTFLIQASQEGHAPSSVIVNKVSGVKAWASLAVHWINNEGDFWGMVVDSSGEPIEDVDVYIADVLAADTDQNGTWKKGNVVKEASPTKFSFIKAGHTFEDVYVYPNVHNATAIHVSES